MFPRTFNLALFYWIAGVGAALRRRHVRDAHVGAARVDEEREQALRTLADEEELPGAAATPEVRRLLSCSAGVIGTADDAGDREVTELKSTTVYKKYFH